MQCLLYTSSPQSSFSQNELALRADVNPTKRTPEPDCRHAVSRRWQLQVHRTRLDSQDSSLRSTLRKCQPCTLLTYRPSGVSLSLSPTVCTSSRRVQPCTLLSSRVSHHPRTLHHNDARPNTLTADPPHHLHRTLHITPSTLHPAAPHP